MFEADKLIEPGRILLVGPGHVGDLLRITPAIEILRRSRPNDFVCVLARSRSAGLLAGNPAVDQIITYDRRSAKWYKPDHLLLRRRLNRLEFGTAIVFTRNALLRRVVAESEISEVLTATMDFSRNRVIHNLDSMNEFGFPGRTDRLTLPFPPGAADRVGGLLANAGYRQLGPLVGVHVGTRAVSRNSVRELDKSWPPCEIARFADLVVESLTGTVVLTGKGREREVSVAICSRSRNSPIDLTDELDLQELAALTRRCDAYVSADTGAMHVAASQLTRLVALFGPTCPEIDAPYMPEDRFVLIKKDDMAAIRAEMVLAAVTGLLSK